MKSIVIAAAIVLSAAVSLAQTAAESIEVRVVNVDVIVRDRAGKPVTGLTKALPPASRFRILPCPLRCRSPCHRPW